MTTQEKKNRIKDYCRRMLEQAHESMMVKVGKALDSGAIDLGAWEEKTNPMLVPRALVTAAMQSEAEQYDCRGTGFERQVKDEVRNLRHFI